MLIHRLLGLVTRKTKIALNRIVVLDWTSNCFECQMSYVYQEYRNYSVIKQSTLNMILFIDVHCYRLLFLLLLQKVSIYIVNPKFRLTKCWKSVYISHSIRQVANYTFHSRTSNFFFYDCSVNLRCSYTKTGSWKCHGLRSRHAQSDDESFTL